MDKPSIEDILNRLHALQAELEAELDRRLTEKREQFHYRLERGKVRFEESMLALQKRHRVGAWQYLREARIGHILTAPVIYAVFLPFLLLDIAVTVYQHICFRVYGIPLVRRSDYIVIDRQYLAYLNAIEKFNCMYCGYANGLIEYIREVTARTEKYWCPIKHARRTPDPHRLNDTFVDYGDAGSYKARLEELRHDWSKLKNS